MADSVPFPFFIFEQDDCSMFWVEMPDKVLYHMEPIDIVNHEYLCCHANSQAVKVSVSGNRVTQIEHCSSAHQAWHRVKESAVKHSRKVDFCRTSSRETVLNG
jgi:hypothetical protein